MKNFGPILIFSLLFVVACTAGSNESKKTTEVQIISPEIPLCDKLFIPGDTIVWQNFQMRNITSVDWNIYNIEVRGNSNCAFKVYRDESLMGETGMKLCPEESSDNPPLGLVVPYKNSTVLRVEYTPSQEGIMDYATIVITSNAQVETYQTEVEQVWADPEDDVPGEESEITKILIPMCGAAILPVPADGGVDETDTDFLPYDCPRVLPESEGMPLSNMLCGEPLSEDTPGCQ